MNIYSISEKARIDGWSKVALITSNEIDQFINNMHIPSQIKEFGVIRISEYALVNLITIGAAANRDYRRGLLTTEERNKFTEKSEWLEYFIDNKFKVLINPEHAIDVTKLHFGKSESFGFSSSNYASDIDS